MLDMAIEDIILCIKNTFTTKYFNGSVECVVWKSTVFITTINYADISFKKLFLLLFFF